VRHILLVSAAILSLLASLAAAHAAPPAGRMKRLQRGLNLTGWFRYAGNSSAEAIGSYLSDAAIRQIAAAGFTFVRVPFDPAFGLKPERRALLIKQLARLGRAGLAVVLTPASVEWRLESRATDRDELIAVWCNLAPALRKFSPERIFPEIVNEPVFAGQVARLQALETEVLARIRAALPSNTVILSGPDWSSIAGLASVEPPSDPNIVYTVHLYDPPELTSLAAYREGLDRAALARLPFPVSDPARCREAARSANEATNRLISFVCGQRWDEGAISRRIGAAASWARRKGVPLFVGEFGASVHLNAPARLAWIAAVRTACEQAGLGWALWGYDDVMGFNLPRPPPARPRFDPELMRALGMRAAEQTKESTQ
jgi:endoglucanase